MKPKALIFRLEGLSLTELSQLVRHLDIGYAPSILILTDATREDTAKLLSSQDLPQTKIITADTNLSESILSTLKDSNIPENETLLFTSRTEDIAAAKTAKIKSIALPAKGGNTAELLRAKPQGLVLSVEEIRAMLSLPSWQDPRSEPQEISKTIDY